MVEITVKASDSASAMEEIEKRLGSDALILATNRVGAEIEIIATNDDVSKYQKQMKPLVLDTKYEVKGFSDVLKQKLPPAMEQGPKNTNSQSVDPIIETSVETIKSELENILNVSIQPNSEEQNSRNLFGLFETVGFPIPLLKEIGLIENKTTVENAAKTIATCFINGRCPNFEESSLFIITGSQASGKTLFSRKLKKFLSNNYEIADCKILSQIDSKNSFNQINAWLTKLDLNEKEYRKTGIVEIPDAATVDQLVLNLNKIHPNLKYSILNVVSVGKSYEFLMKNLAPKRLENEYLALLKMDLCDLSMPEIRAFIELSHRCMFFSGVPSQDEGLFYAKVDKTISHIMQTVEKMVDQ